MQYFKTLCLSGLSLLSLTVQAQASESAWLIKRDSAYWEVQGGYGRFTDSNKPTQQLSLLAHGEVGILETATLLLDFPFLTRSEERSGQTPATLVNNGFTDLLVGTRIKLLDEPFGLNLRAATRIPIGYNPSFAPVIGDHTLDWELGLGAGYHFYPLEAYIQGGLGYRMRLKYDASHILVAQAKAQGQSLSKPSDQIMAYLEAGIWILPQLFASVSLNSDLGLTQSEALSQSQLMLRPLLAWRLNNYLDLSAQLDQSLWSQRQPFLTQFLLGAHFHYGLPLEREKGLRGGVADYAERDDSLD